MSFIISHYNEQGKALESYVGIGGESAMMTVKALWDTGISQSCISSDVVKMIEPICRSKSKMATVDTVVEVEIYAISIAFSDEVVIRDILVEKRDLSDKGVDMLIGMDILSRGDFEIHNYNGLLQFAFRVPPKNEPINLE